MPSKWQQHTRTKTANPIDWNLINKNCTSQCYFFAAILWWKPHVISGVRRRRWWRHQGSHQTNFGKSDSNVQLSYGCIAQLFVGRQRRWRCQVGTNNKWTSLVCDVIALCAMVGKRKFPLCIRERNRTEAYAWRENHLELRNNAYNLKTIWTGEPNRLKLFQITFNRITANICFQPALKWSEWQK